MPSNSSTPTKTDPHADHPSVIRQLFGSILTPSWTMALVLLAVLFIPSYSGCNSEPITIGTGLIKEVSTGTIGNYLTFVILFPQIFALITLATVFLMVFQKDWGLAYKKIWATFFILSWVNLAWCLAWLLTLVVADGIGNEPTSFKIFIVVWCLVSLVPIIIGLVVGRQSGSKVAAVHGLQIFWSFAAVLCTNIWIPTIVIAQKLLVGGILACVATSVLFTTSLIQLMTGPYDPRADTRGVQLTLKQCFILMTIGGVLFAWGAGLAIYPRYKPAQPVEATNGIANSESPTSGRPTSGKLTGQFSLTATASESH